MFGTDEKMCSFVMGFINMLDTINSIEEKIEKSLPAICDQFGFKKAFVYQTDGFRFYYLKESFGDGDNVLKPKFEFTDLTEEHLAILENKQVYLSDISAGKNDLVSGFYNTDSVIISKVLDTDNKVIGFLGFENNDNRSWPSEDELKILQLITSVLSKEIAIREYIDRRTRTKKTLESIMNNMGVDIYVNSFDTHEMLYVNKSMAAPYGGTEAFDGKKCWEALYTDKTGECDFCPKWKLIDEKGVPSKVFSWDYRRPFDGSWFRVFSAAFDWIDGQLAHVVTSVDITNQKQIEAELEKAKCRAEELDGLKSTFLANMSHEIRTPLNAIVGFSDLLVYEEDLESRELYMRLIRENNDLLLQLISDILDISKIESGMLEFEYTLVDLYALCEDIAKTYIVKEKFVPVVFRTDEPRLIIRTDKKRLTQIITNFINNAIKFTTEGEIILSYSRTEEDTVEISVTDTGTGIEADKVGKVFDRFIKLDSYAKGTGLGLAISKLIIETLKGKIGVSSTVGVGSKFWVTHPYSK